MADLGQTGFDQFDRIVAIVRRTRELLDAVASDGELPDGGSEYLSDETLPHLESVQRGFRGWLRADSAGHAELRFLIGQAGPIRAAATLESLTAADRSAAYAEAAADARTADPNELRSSRLRESEGWHLAALDHARLVLAFLPRLPEGSVRYPAGRRTYADIPVPRGPAELAQRIDELERELWRTATGHARPAVDGPFRRTYGFFDASAHLADSLPG